MQLESNGMELEDKHRKWHIHSSNIHARQANLHAKMLIQVHDELLLECPKGELNETIEIVREVMENAYALKVPLATDVAWGTNWGDLKDMD